MDYTSIIQENIGKLNRLLLTVTKNPYRKFLIKTLVNKTQINETILKKLAERKHLLTLKSVAQAIIFIFRSRKSLIKNTIMAAPKFDIKLGTNLVQVFDGNPETLETFIASADLFEDFINAEFQTATDPQKAAAQVTLVKIFKTRLSGDARDAASSKATKDEIVAVLREQCSSTTTSDNIIAKLKTLKQKDSAETFCKGVEKMANQLKILYIKEQIPAEKASEMATKRGVEALIEGIKNAETKTILKAGTFVKLNDACQKVIENSNTTNSSVNAQVFAARNQQQGRGSRGTNTRGNLPRNNYYGRKNKYKFNQHHQEGQRGNWRQPSRFHRGNYRGNNARVFFNSGNTHVDPSTYVGQEQQQQQENPQRNLGFQLGNQRPQQLDQTQNQVALAQLMPRW